MADDQISFEKDISPLFREKDRQSMLMSFDLRSYDDVCRHAAAILDRVQDGSMPCDRPWPEERSSLFERWTETGMPR